MQGMWEIRPQQQELQGRSRRELLLAWECIPSQQDHQEGKYTTFVLDICVVLFFSWQLINCYCACAQPTVHRAQPSSTDDVTTTAPPPPTDNQSNPRPKRQRKRSAVTTETLNASRNATKYMAAMRFARRQQVEAGPFFCYMLRAKVDTFFFFFSREKS